MQVALPSRSFSLTSTGFWFTTRVLTATALCMIVQTCLQDWAIHVKILSMPSGSMIACPVCSIMRHCACKIGYIYLMTDQKFTQNLPIW